MILELRLPFFERGVNAVRVVAWLKDVGERVEPGEDLVVVDTEPRVKLDIPRSAKKLARLESTKSTTGTRQVNVRIRLRVTAVEPVIVRKLIGTPGAICPVGELLGIVSTAPSEPLDVSPQRHMRVVVNQEDVA
jgi:TusA-related sulfurtransferase